MLADHLTAPLNTIKKLGDLKTIGVENIESYEVKEASIHNGKLILILEAPQSSTKRLPTGWSLNRSLTLSFPNTNNLQAGHCLEQHGMCNNSTTLQPNPVPLLCPFAL